MKPVPVVVGHPAYPHEGGQKLCKSKREATAELISRGFLRKDIRAAFARAQASPGSFQTISSRRSGCGEVVSEFYFGDC